MVYLELKEKQNKLEQFDDTNQIRRKSLLRLTPQKVHLDKLDDDLCNSSIKMPTSSSLSVDNLYKMLTVLSSNNNCVHTNTVSKTTNTTATTTTKRITRKSRIRTNHLPMIIVFSLALIMSCLTTMNAFQLDGSQSSFAQFRKWYVGLNGSLELEFKTEQPNGLVLYTDDGGTYDFFELKLVEGALRLRYNLGGGAQIITVGRDLHDGHWHKVQVS